MAFVLQWRRAGVDGDFLLFRCCQSSRSRYTGVGRFLVESHAFSTASWIEANPSYIACFLYRASSGAARLNRYNATSSQRTYPMPDYFRVSTAFHVTMCSTNNETTKCFSYLFFTRACTRFTYTAVRNGCCCVSGCITQLSWLRVK